MNNILAVRVDQLITELLESNEEGLIQHLLEETTLMRKILEVS